MRAIYPCLFFVLVLIPRPAAAESWLNAFSAELRELEHDSARTQQALDALDFSTVGQTTPQVGYQHPRLPAPPLIPAWVQVDLEQSHAIDAVVLVPAQIDWQSHEGPSYGFPPCFRVDFSDDPEFTMFVSVAIFTEHDFSGVGIAPVVIPADGRQGRYVRVTVTKMAEENQQHFFSLAELLVLSGNLNLAIGRPVSASASSTVRPRWSLSNLVDGRTPLGPPIRRELLPWDGMYAGVGTDGSPPHMELDLGRMYAVQQVRLHPVHARIGADVPGYAFPATLRVEISPTADFAQSVVLLEVTHYPNPGNNPVVLDGKQVAARYLRVTATDVATLDTRRRFGLSEVEVYADGKNVAPGATVKTTPEPTMQSMKWPTSVLVDGFASYGRLLELPEWFRRWERRRELRKNLVEMNRRKAILVARVEQRLIWSAAGAGMAGLAALVGVIVVTRRRRQREFRELRLRLARDLHDEIGSNLAGIAVLSEVAKGESQPDSAQAENWAEIHRIAQETMTAMREVLWLVGGRDDGGDLMAHLRVAADRMLGGKDVQWKSSVGQLAADWPIEAKRELFLFFKEALSNIVRHSQAQRVELSIEASPVKLELEIFDHGVGFDLNHARRGIGLLSQEQRARVLDGTVKIESAPGRGTRVRLTVPLKKNRRPALLHRKSRQSVL